ncbi:MAG TPA: SRPBCC family protein, partial [Rhodanobacteraceae bacterium]|nr:SRPBCC family protein [Rhodanobacteraceae bacterium]
MKNTGTLKVETRGDREIVMTRVFDAPRELVFRALTTPELLKRWFGPHGWTLTECEVDLRVGGAWRFLSAGPNGHTMGMRGVYREIVPFERIQYTESFDEWAGQGSALITTTLAERDGRTTLTVVSLAPSREVRDAVIQS